MTTTINIRALLHGYGGVIDRVQAGERFVVTWCKEPAIALVSLVDLEQLQDMELLLEQIDRGSEPEAAKGDEADTDGQEGNDASID